MILGLLACLTSLIKLFQVANRLWEVLPKLISFLQSVYVPNRAIHDNILITHEYFSILKRKEEIRLSSDKLDMEKAYVD